jgi:hypothetical protein
MQKLRSGGRPFAGVFGSIGSLALPFRGRGRRVRFHAAKVLPELRAVPTLAWKDGYA